MYEVAFAESAKRGLHSLENPVQKRIIAALERSRIRPHHFFTRLVGNDVYRMRVGDYRIIADIKSDVLLVLVLEIGHRKKIYKRS